MAGPETDYRWRDRASIQPHAPSSTVPGLGARQRGSLELPREPGSWGIGVQTGPDAKWDVTAGVVRGCRMSGRLRATVWAGGVEGAAGANRGAENKPHHGTRVQDAPGCCVGWLGRRPHPRRPHAVSTVGPSTSLCDCPSQPPSLRLSFPVTPGPFHTASAGSLSYLRAQE